MARFPPQADPPVADKVQGLLPFLIILPLIILLYAVIRAYPRSKKVTLETPACFMYHAPQ